MHRLKKSTPELGIWTKRSAHGEHIGREAIGGLLSLAASLGFDLAFYPVDRRNVASRKIPEFYGGMRLAEPDGAEFLAVRSATGRALEIVRYGIPLVKI